MPPVADIVVLLTDGANTRGVEPLAAADEAAGRGVRVYTIGFGTTTPAGLACTPAQLGGDVFDEFGGGFGGGGFGGADPAAGGFGGGGGGPGGGGRRRFLVIDEPTLQAVADRTGGAYYRAESAEQLLGVFDDLPRDVQRQREHREITAWFALAAAVLLAGAVATAPRLSGGG